MPEVSSVPTLAVVGEPVPGVPTFVCVPSNVLPGETLMSRILKRSCVNVIVSVVIVPV